MRIFKSQCSLFKDMYILFSKKQVEEETRKWMEQHRKECDFCSKWSKSIDESREDKIAY